MKLLAVFLSLAAVIGSSSSDEPASNPPTWKQILSPFDSFKVPEEISTQAAERFSRVQSQLAELKDQLLPALQKVTEDLQELNRKVQPFTEALDLKLRSGISKVQERVAPYTEKLREQAEQRMETLQQTLASGREKLTQNVEDIRAQLEPLVKDAKTKIQQRTQEFRPVMQRLHSNLRQTYESLQVCAEDFQGCLAKFMLPPQ
ncbi:apolipoprotein A-I-like [Lacerta agilis]|uniref:apolipoprotein A-I-like n=1 Tax=Lacerta agilis TaxID=80427 RepID=UPI00141A3F83|nr:apolipoprotein A-I-like [Lacerta agilis]